MQRCKRLVSLLLVLCLALSLTAMGASALEAAPTEELDELEKLATDYVTAYIENIYLDGGNDLSKATVAELAADAAVESSLSLPMEQQVLVGRELTTLSKLCDNITFLDETAQYYGYLQTAQGSKVENFSLSTTTVERKIDGTYGYVHLYALAEYQYPELDEPSAAGDHYVVEFLKTNAGWTIVNMTVEFLEAYGVEPETFDLQASIQAADEAFRQPVVTVSDPVETQTVTSSAYYYNKAAAVAYSMVYTTSRDNIGVYDFPEFCNQNFTYYTDDINNDCGVNCQNYVSQCLWAGFGGSNISTKIKRNIAPMDDSGSLKWYWDTGGSSSSWTAVDTFLDYADASNSVTGETGLRSSIEYVAGGSNFTISASSLVGSVLALYMDGDDSPDHAILVVTADSTERPDVYFNGNSPMRKSKRLGDEFLDTPLKVIVPLSMDVIGDHTHTYTNRGNWTGVVCNTCGYNKTRIRINPPYRGCFPKGTTCDITGSVGFTCYRIAVGITDPSGNTSWSQYTNTSSVSRSYTFSQAGLYNIRIAVRNMPESYGSESDSISLDFTLRTY